MANIDPEKITAPQLKTQTQKPHTRAEELRHHLKLLETRLVRLSEINREEALEILILFDQAEQIATELQERGMNTASELGQIETLTAQFYKKRAQFIRRIGGSQELAKAREVRQPSKDSWWWYADQTLAVESKQKMIRWLRNFAFITVILIILAMIYQRFFAPDPATQASYGHQTRGENALIQRDLETALVEVQNAIALTPDHPDLYVLQGVIQEGLGHPEEARSSFEIALQKFDPEEGFYNQRATLYLMMGDAERGLADSQAAIQINPDSTISYLTQGQAYEILGDFPKAIDSYEIADEIAQRIGNAQLQAIVRVTLSNAMQRIPIPTFETTDSSGGD